MGSIKKKVNTIGWTGEQLNSIGSKKTDLSIIAGEYSRNKGSTKKIYK